MHEVAGVHHRPPVRAVAHEREPPAAHGAQPLRLPRPAGAGRRTTAAARSPRRRRPAGRPRQDQLLGLLLRRAVAEVRACTATSSSKRWSGCGFTPKGELDDTCTSRPMPARRARSSTSAVPPDVDVEQLPHRPRGWMTAAAWTTVAPGRPRRRARSSAAGSRTSPTTGSHRAAGEREHSRLVVGLHEHAHVRRARAPALDEVPAEPAARAGDDDARRGGGHRRGQEVVGVAGGEGHDRGLGVHAGRLREDRRVADAEVLDAPHRPEAVHAARAPGRSPMRTDEVRWTVIRLARRRSTGVPPARRGRRRRVHDRRPRDRRVQLGGPGGEERLAEVHEAAGQAAEVAVGEPVGDERRRQPGEGAHPPAGVAADARVVHEAVLPVVEQRARRRHAGVGQRQAEVARAGWPSRRSRCDGANSVMRSIGTSSWSSALRQPGHDLHRGVHLEPRPDAAPEPAPLQQRGRLHGAAAHDDLLGARP